MKKTSIIILLIILLSFAVGIYFFDKIPEKMASHWNAKGEVDGFAPKFWGLFLMPIISVFLFLLFLLIPKIDPLRNNIEKFRKYFDGFIVLIILFFFYIYILAILWNIGIRFSMNYFLPPAIAIIFYYAGILIENTKRNWFIGIRTPWTLSSETVWEKTHKIGAKLFKLTAIIAFLGIFFVNYAFYFIIIPAMVVTIYITIFSYFEYQKEINKN